MLVDEFSKVRISCDKCWLFNQRESSPLLLVHVTSTALPADLPVRGPRRVTSHRCWQQHMMSEACNSCYASRDRAQTGSTPLDCCQLMFLLALDFMRCFASDNWRFQRPAHLSRWSVVDRAVLDRPIVERIGCNSEHLRLRP